MNHEGAVMKAFLFFGLIFIASHAVSAESHGVKGYAKKNGTYVQPHRQTNPDPKRANNYSSEGNVNPNTGKKGTKRTENSVPPQYNDSYNNGQGKQLNQLYGNKPKKGQKN